MTIYNQKIMKRVFSVIFVFFVFFPIFSQKVDSDGFVEIDIPQEKEQKKNENAESQDLSSPLFSPKSRGFFVTAGAILLLNLDDSKNSAPSPICYSLGFGADFRQDKAFNFGFRASFFTNYWLYDGENARPAEVENRTATALSFMLDATCGRTFVFSRGLNSLSVSGGLGFLARVGFLSNGVSGSESGATGDASGDVSKINSWFWSSARFLMPELCISYLRAVPSLLNDFRFGAEFRAYAPLGSLVSGNGIDGMIFSLALKASF